MLDPNEPSKGWIMAVNIWKSCEHCGWKNKYRIDPHSYEHYWTSSWNKAWKKFRPIQDLNPWPLWYWCSALPTELTSQLELVIMLDTNKPLKWWIMAVNIWKSYVCTAVEETNIESILATLVHIPPVLSHIILILTWNHLIIIFWELLRGLDLFKVDISSPVLSFGSLGITRKNRTTRRTWFPRSHSMLTKMTS